MKLLTISSQVIHRLILAKSGFKKPFFDMKNNFLSKKLYYTAKGLYLNKE